MNQAAFAFSGAGGMVCPQQGDHMRLATVLAGALCLASTALAQENPRNLAAACAICHGTEGRAVTTDVVSLAGKPRDEIAAQMREIRDGNRPVTVMHQIA